MSLFGPGVGGGVLAGAGALAGLGQGMATAGEVGLKQQMAEKTLVRQNELETARETTLERLRQGGAQALQKGEQTFQHNENLIRQQLEMLISQNVIKHQDAMKAMEIVAKHQDVRTITAAELDRAGIAGSARVLAAIVNASGRAGAGGNKALKGTGGWSIEKGNVGGTIDPATGQIVGGHPQYNPTRNGVTYAQATGPDGTPWHVPTDSSGNPMQLKGAYPVPNAALTQHVIQDPGGMSPTGQTFLSEFVNRYGGAPSAAISNYADQLEAKGGATQLPSVGMKNGQLTVTGNVQLGAGGGNANVTAEQEDNTPSQATSYANQ